MKKLCLAIALVSVVSPVWAALQTVKLSVPGMTCPACPITIKKALSKVEGVRQVDVNFDKKVAIVRFDDAKTDVEALLRATANVGYPSTVKK